jgi:hypothetical protein
MRRIYVTVATIAVALSLAGCGGNDNASTSTTGTVLEVQEAGDPLVFTLSADAQSSLNGAIITVAAKDLKGAQPADVARGDNVKVVTQACASSMPPQCQATSVEVLDK